MTSRTRVNVSNALILALLGIVVVESTAIASRRAKKPRTQETRTVSANAPAKSLRGVRAQAQPIVVAVVREGSPTIVFADKATSDVALTQKKIRGFEAALANEAAPAPMQRPSAPNASGELRG
jgi:hypothetical protein